MAIQRNEKGQFIRADETPEVPATPALVPLSSSFPARYRVGTSPDGPQIQQLYRRNPQAVRRFATHGAGKLRQMAIAYLEEVGDAQ